MKKLVLALALAFASSGISAQDTTVLFEVKGWDSLPPLEMELNFDQGNQHSVVHGRVWSPQPTAGLDYLVVGACREDATASLDAFPNFCQINFFGDLVELYLPFIEDLEIGGTGEALLYFQSTGYTLAAEGTVEISTVEVVPLEAGPPGPPGPQGPPGPPGSSGNNSGQDGSTPSVSGEWMDLRSLEIKDDYVDGDENCGVEGATWRWRYTEGDLYPLVVQGNQNEAGCLGSMFCDIEWQNPDESFGTEFDSATIFSSVTGDTSVTFEAFGVENEPMWVALSGCTIFE